MRAVVRTFTIINTARNLDLYQKVAEFKNREDDAQEDEQSQQAKSEGEEKSCWWSFGYNEFDGPVFLYIPIGIFAYFSHSRTTIAQRCQIGCELSQAHVRMLHYQIQIKCTFASHDILQRCTTVILPSMRPDTTGSVAIRLVWILNMFEIQRRPAATACATATSATPRTSPCECSCNSEKIWSPSLLNRSCANRERGLSNDLVNLCESGTMYLLEGCFP